MDCVSYEKMTWNSSDIIALVAILISFGSLVVSLVALKNQRTEWLNDAFIKHEADVLLEFRIAYGEAGEAISFFLDTLLTPVKMDIHIKEPPSIKREKVIKYFNAINKLNNLYNKNQYIFRKHNLEKSISCLTCLLDVARMLPEGDLEFRLVEQDDKVKTYQLTEWNKTIQIFTFSAYPILNQVRDANEPIIQLENKNMNEEFNRLKGLVSNELNSLTWKLDKLTLYNEGTNQTNMDVRHSKFYQPLSK